MLCVMLFLAMMYSFGLQAQPLKVNAPSAHYLFGDNMLSGGFIPKDIYSQIVETMPICCVDLFLYDPEKKAYFLAKRTNPPLKDIAWLLGGRLNKAESFFDCAKRKAKEEANLEIEPMAIIGTFSTVFPDSAWNCSTHTVNVTVFAINKSANQVEFPDNSHAEFSWIPINQKPQDLYLENVYKKALNYIKKNKENVEFQI